MAKFRLVLAKILTSIRPAAATLSDPTAQLAPGATGSDGVPGSQQVVIEVLDSTVLRAFHKLPAPVLALVVFLISYLVPAVYNLFADPHAPLSASVVVQALIAAVGAGVTKFFAQNSIDAFIAALISMADGSAFHTGTVNPAVNAAYKTAVATPAVDGLKQPQNYTGLQGYKSAAASNTFANFPTINATPTMQPFTDTVSKPALIVTSPPPVKEMPAISDVPVDAAAAAPVEPDKKEVS